jgi:hypothetical protein
MQKIKQNIRVYLNFQNMQAPCQGLLPKKLNLIAISPAK